MNSKSQQWINNLYWAIIASMILLGTVVYMVYAKDYWLLIIITVLTIAIILFNYSGKHKHYVFRIGKTAIVTSFIFVIIYILLAITHLGELLQNGDNIKNMINDSGFIGMLIYFLLCLLQVVILPIPSVVLTLIGANVFGSTVAFIITTLATIIGSMIAFFMGRKWGKKLVVWLVGEKLYQKYNRVIKYNGKYYLAIMFLLPVFPDDILCMLAGISNMGVNEFFWICLLTRPIMIAFTCYFGTGEIIPFDGYGIPIWIAIFLIFILIFFFSKYIVKKFDKSKKNKKTVPNISADN